MIQKKLKKVSRNLRGWVGNLREHVLKNKSEFPDELQGVEEIEEI